MWWGEPVQRGTFRVEAEAREFAKKLGKARVKKLPAYQVLYRDTKGRLHGETFSRLEDAEGYRDSVAIDVRKGTFRDLRPATRALCEQVAKLHLLPEFGRRSRGGHSPSVRPSA